MAYQTKVIRCLEEDGMAMILLERRRKLRIFHFSPEQPRMSTKNSESTARL